ncbi:helix-turn-helix domain-containing protein [Franconibacter helveticus 513]|uniref:winged helix-turn-helix transcriptional regulator n=1 Tax=Franconibacter helveticus TaxID=357240 RepID=UPI000A7B1707|nr:winged helix-turn-helix transcriptional regulator [Franconibacter helveticus]
MTISPAPDDKSSMTLSPPNKPVTQINNLIEYLIPYSSLFSIKTGETIQYSNGTEKQCFLLHKGVVTQHRQGDGLVLSTDAAPFVFGLSNQFSLRDTVYLRGEEPCLLSRLSLEKAVEVIAEKALWESQSRLLAFESSRLYDQCARTAKMSSYDIIRDQLLELMNEPQSVRLNITAANYIKSRCFLSRSGIMRILSELRTGGYIKIDRGILLQINHLPLKY